MKLIPDKVKIFLQPYQLFQHVKTTSGKKTPSSMLGVMAIIFSIAAVLFALVCKWIGFEFTQLSGFGAIFFLIFLLVIVYIFPIWFMMKSFLYIWYQFFLRTNQIRWWSILTFLASVAGCGWIYFG